MSTQIGPSKEDPACLPIELHINRHKVYAMPGQTILDVVREQNLDTIPTLCYEPRLGPHGSCSLCVVEVKGAPRLLPACVTRIRDGMDVTTKSERITRARKMALELLLSDHYAECVCPAHTGCPAGVDVQGYLGLARLGCYSEALALIRERNPLPLVCGRVCVRTCELKCLRNGVDEPVGINFVKRFVAEHVSAEAIDQQSKHPSGKHIAIVGGGPAGLTCANYLALRGHAVTIFEAFPKLGGMLRYGIPEYRLPRAELDKEIQQIINLGVVVETGKILGRDFTLAGLLKPNRFDAVFLAVGAPLSKKMGIKGEDHLEGLQPALSLLRGVELQGPPKLCGKVVVVGGGNSAIDAARTALRCGADMVTILYRRTRNEMPAHPEEVDAAEKEGAKLEILVAPVEVLAGNGRITAVRCQRMQLGEPDASGRRRPVPIPGAEIQYPCNYLFTAIGQDTDLTILEAEPAYLRPAASRQGTLETDPATTATSVKGVFAGGDVVNGPSAVIDAIAQGRLTAHTIDLYLKTEEVPKPKPDFLSRREIFGAPPEWLFEEVEKSKRCTMPERDARVRACDFALVELGLPEPQIQVEANRCMECGCRSVFECELKHQASVYEIDIRRFAGEARRHRIDRSHPLISLDPNKCILCGRCIRICADIVGLAVFGFVGRGFATTVKPSLGKTLAESACIACGECVESCPTGAIEARLPHGRQGPWKARQVSSVCNFCSLGCELELNVVSESILWATASENRVQGGLCLKGRFGTGLIHGPARLKLPLVRINGKLEETEWDEAISAAARTLEQRHGSDGPESTAVFVAPRMTLEEAWLVRHLATVALGTSVVGSIGQHLRGGPRHDLDDILGETASTCTVDDIRTADLILLGGADPGSTHPVLAMTIRWAAKHGAEIVAVNSSPVDLLQASSLWLDARRGTAGILYAAILNRLLGDGSCNRGVRTQDGCAGLKSSVAPATVEEAAHLCGIETSRIEACVAKLAGAKKVIAVYDLDDTLERATDDLRALAQIMMFTGHMRKDGGGILLLQSDCNSGGARLAGIARPLRLDGARTALVIMENPFGDNRAAKELAGIQSLVVIDHFLTETGRLADVVLPAATLAESEGTIVSCDGRFHKISRAVRPLSGLTTAGILARLSRALNQPAVSADPVRIRTSMAHLLGIPVSEFEKARSLGLPLQYRPMSARTLRPLRLDSSASVANVFPYATLDAFLNKKLEEVGLAK